MGQAQSDPTVSTNPTNTAKTEREGGRGKKKSSVAQRFLGLVSLLSSIRSKKNRVHPFTSSQDTLSGDGSIGNGPSGVSEKSLSTCQPNGLFEPTLNYWSQTPCLSTEMDLNGSVLTNINSVDSYRANTTSPAFLTQPPQNMDLSGMCWLNANMSPTLNAEQDLTKGFRKPTNNIHYTDEEDDISYIEDVIEPIFEANKLLNDMYEDGSLNNS
ncbi:uncharacterized protein LOC125293510 [Alosa alosa]|uniref:uncharacterized protein LOC125293510 n=1 Tax=Alosa alosa TaxID=278164 RepID=UPI0020151129|nr:uncharacterized protein LOC125293510 [Alosa alosa]